MENNKSLTKRAKSIGPTDPCAWNDGDGTLISHDRNAFPQARPKLCNHSWRAPHKPYTTGVVNSVP